jgi:hypothetical protein
MLNLETWKAFEFYKTFLHWYCEWYEPRYLEIGCLGGDLCASLKTKLSVGVDVNEHPDWSTYMQRSERVLFYQMPSDQFFKQNSQDWDLIFIDGDHSAKQVYKDVLNSLKWLAPGGLIVMHDTLPPTEGDTAETKSGTAYVVRRDLQRDSKLQVYTFPVTFGLTLVAPVGSEWPW